MNFLRGAVWENLLQAERIIDRRLRPVPYLEVLAVDHSYSGEKELVINSDRFSLLLATPGREFVGTVLETGGN